MWLGIIRILHWNQQLYAAILVYKSVSKIKIHMEQSATANLLKAH